MVSPHRMLRLTIVAGFVLFLLVVPAPAATTQLKVVRYAEDGSTILNETTITYQWMRDNLPVQGDGATHYYHQGPVFVDDPDSTREMELRWNSAEDTNVQEKDMGAVKGTDLKDLCDLAGGITEGETVDLKARDGLTKTFAYKNIYNPPARQGMMVISWYCTGIGTCPGPYPDTGYADGMRLVFFADASTNPWGIHAFGNWDWHEAADEEYWYYYFGSPTEKYPTTTGLSVKYISEVRLMTDDPAVGDISVTSSPAGAAIFVDDADTGTVTNGSVNDLDLGLHVVKAVLDGYREPLEQEADVRWGVPAMLHFNLVRMEGSIQVSSTPPGTEVYLDGNDTGKMTPCTLTAVAIGDHSVTVKLSGYTDASDTVTVEDGEMADLDLELTSAGQGSGSGATDSSSSLPGGSLTTLGQGMVEGGFILANTTGPARRLEAGASATWTLRADLPPNATPALARLYLFTDQEPSATVAGGNTDPSITIAGMGISPDAIYRDCRPGSSPCIRSETRVWDLMARQLFKGEIQIGLKHPGGQAGAITWYGASLAVVYEREGDPETLYWISEGADDILSDRENNLPESETRTEAGFPGEVNRTRADEAVLIPVSTVPGGGGGEGHLVIFNDNEWISPLAGAGISSARLEVRPDLETTGNHASVVSTGISRQGDLLENRIIVLIVSYGNAGSGEDTEGISPPAVSAPGATVPEYSPTEIVATHTLPPPEGEDGNLTEESPGASGTSNEASFLDQIIGFFSSLLGGLLGLGETRAADGPGPENLSSIPAPAEIRAVPSETISAKDITPQEVSNSCCNLTITSSPRRALISLDRVYLEKVTPATLTCVKSGQHLIGLERDDFKPQEIAIDLQGDIAVHANMTSAYTSYASLIRDYDEGINGEDHCGGVYVESFPEKAKIVLDGRDTGILTNSILYGLKPGLHTIRIQMDSTELPDNTRQVWVYPSITSRVHFETYPPIACEVTVESEVLRKAEFTVNGRYPAYRIPRKVTLPAWDSFITIRDNGTYLSYPADSIEYNGTLQVKQEQNPLSTVQVLSHPGGADILIDGFPTGLTTPALVRNLSAGRHRVLVTAPGYIPQDQEILQLDLPGDGPDTVVEVYLEPYTHGSLEVTSTPPGARIFLFQRDTGEKTPHVFPYLGIGSYDVKLESQSDSRTIYDMIVTPYQITSRHVNMSAF